VKAVHPDDHARVMDVWNEASATKSRYEVECRIRGHDGAYRHFVVRGVPVFEPNGEIREWVGTCIDITELKVAQDAIREREALISVAAHELKTPLASLLGYARLLLSRAVQGRPFSEREQRGLHSIVDQGERINRMLNVLLDLSRIETGRFKIERAPVDVQQVVERVIEELRPTLTMHSIVYTGAGELLIVTGDDLRLEQVLHNLLNNAIKYSPDGGTIEVEVRRHGPSVCIAVRDPGVGIPPEAVSRIFGRFYRAETAGSPTIGGLGIGLYVVKEIIAHHGGTIDVASVQGQGSTFTICLPLAVQPPSDPRQSS
jgi:signal transduction histidine kinase